MSPRKKSPPVDDLAFSDEALTIANLAAEKSVLGAMLESDSIQDAVLKADLLVPEDFSVSSYVRIFRIIKELHEKNCPANIVSLAEELGNRQYDYALLSDLISGVILDARHTLYLAQVVRNKSRLRRIRELGESIVSTATEHGCDPDQLIRETSERLASL